MPGQGSGTLDILLEIISSLPIKRYLSEFVRHPKIFLLSSLKTMLCDILFTDHPLLKRNINHKVKLERKKCCISNPDSTAVALTSVLFGKSQKVNTSRVNLSWLTVRLAFSGFVFLLFCELFRHSSPDPEGFRDQQLKLLLWEMHSHLSMQPTSACIRGRKALDIFFFISLKTSTRQPNSTLLN